MDNIQKKLTYAIGVIAVISGILWVSLTNIETPQASDVNALYVLTGIMLFIAVATTVVTSMIQLFSDKKQLKQAGIVLGLVVLVAVISYVLASDEVVVFLGVALSTSIESKLVGMGLFATYIAGTVAILSIIAAPLVIKLIKK